MRQTLQLGALSAVNLGLGFAFQWCALTQLGPGIESDALVAGMTLPQLILAIVSASLMHVLVPLLAGEDSIRFRQDVWSFTLLVGVLFSVVAALLFVSAPWWVPLTVPGFNAVGIALTLDLTRIQLIGMIFMAINGVQWAAYHAQQRFFWAETAPILTNAVALLLLLWALPRFGVLAVAWVGIFRLAMQTVLFLPGMGKPALPDFSSPAIRLGWLRIKPLLLGTAYYKTDPLIDRFLLSSANNGMLSLYYLALQIYSAANQVLNKAIAAPTVPLLSSLHKTGKQKDFSIAYRRRLNQIIAVSIVIFILLGFLGHFILSLWIGYGRINVQDVNTLWWLMICLGGVFIGGAIGQLCSAAFYARGDTATPTQMSIVTYTLYVPSKIFSYYLWGVEGLAIAASMYFLLNATLQIYFLNKK